MEMRRRVAELVFLSLFCFVVDGGGLSSNFYQLSCPQVENIVRQGIAPIFLADPTSPAAFLRLMFHDCQVQGCDASILLDSGESEMGSSKNFGIRKRETIGIIKSMVEAKCPRQVSCADIIVLVAREAVAMSGGPHITVPLGRRDAATVSSELADASLPPSNTGVDGMLRLFPGKGMTIEESVAILGAHTIGITHCVNILDRLAGPESDSATRGMGPGFEMFLKLSCPVGSLAANSTFVGNDLTIFSFDNQYYRNALGGRGVLRIDADMSIDPRTAPIIARFAVNQDDFFRAFTSAFLKLSFSSVLTGNQGVIRKSCSLVD